MRSGMRPDREDKEDKEGRARGVKDGKLARTLDPATRNRPIYISRGRRGRDC